jgi:hypothetical protein
MGWMEIDSLKPLPNHHWKQIKLSWSSFCIIIRVSRISPHCACFTYCKQHWSFHESF